MNDIFSSISEACSAHLSLLRLLDLCRDLLVEGDGLRLDDLEDEPDEEEEEEEDLARPEDGRPESEGFGDFGPRLPTQNTGSKLL